ncbi:MAG TPA: TIGR01459 family HAD-type hydrolase [Saprospiraceae bacterium]|nr:TIGR01459 family HAD-type hydrolase [Saprospiraceae bacterium]
MILCDFSSIIDDYDLFFFDSYGVIRNHNGLITGIEKTIKYLQDRDKTIRILTNDASRDAKALLSTYVRLGIKSLTEDQIISSGMMARSYLATKVRNGMVVYLGTERSASYITQAGLQAIPIGKVTPEIYDEISAIVFLDDEGYDWNVDLNKTYNLLRSRNIPAIVANTDKVYPKSDKELNLATGAVARILETISGRTFIKFGKPDTQMYIYALESVPNYHTISKSKMLMIGDTLHTDIMGGNKFGIATTLVLSGNTSEKEADLMIRSTSIIPDFICRSAGLEY